MRFMTARLIVCRVSPHKNVLGPPTFVMPFALFRTSGYGKNSVDNVVLVVI
jgi:hypothetical protein